jgi:hypothetical protein
LRRIWRHLVSHPARGTLGGELGEAGAVSTGSTGPAIEANVDCTAPLAKASPPRSPQRRGGLSPNVSSVYNRDYGTRTTPDMRQRFSVGSDGKVTLDPGDSVVVNVAEDGSVTVAVQEPEAAETEPTTEPTTDPSAPTPITLPAEPTQMPGPPPEGASWGPQPQALRTRRQQDGAEHQ